MIRSVAAVFGTQVLTIAFGVAISILSARLLGPSGRGTLAVAVLLGGIVASVAGLGLPYGLTYQIAGARDRKAELSRAVSVCLRVLPVSLLLASLIYIVAFFWGRASVFRGLTPVLFFSSFVLCVLSVAWTVLLSIFSGLHDFKLRNLSVGLAPAVSLGVLLVAWVWAEGLEASDILLIQNVGIGGTVLVGVACLWRSYGAGFGKPLFRGWGKAYVLYGVTFQLAIIAQALNYRLDVFLLNHFEGNYAVGLYAVGVGVAEFLNLVPNAVILVLYPKIVAAPEGVRDRLAAMTAGICMYIVAVGAVFLWVTAELLVPLAFGAGFMLAVPAAMILFPGMVGLSIVKVLAHALAGVGRPGSFVYVTWAGLALTLALDLILIPRNGILGAAWASTAVYWCTAILTLIVFAKVRKLSISWFVVELAWAPVNALKHVRRSAGKP